MRQLTEEVKVMKREEQLLNASKDKATPFGGLFGSSKKSRSSASTSSKQTSADDNENKVLNSSY